MYGTSQNKVPVFIFVELSTLCNVITEDTLEPCHLHHQHV